MFKDKVVCIVVPCYNEEARLATNIFIDFIDKNDLYRFIFVNDGSKDNTMSSLESIRLCSPDKVKIVDLKSNVGKGEAVRLGSLSACKCFEFDFIGYLDADLSAPIEVFNSLFCHKNLRDKHLLIIGSRIKMMGVKIVRHPLRHYFGRVFATLASLVLRLPIYDTQCGAKLIHHELVPTVFSSTFSTRWLFDVEILARIISNFGYLKANEIIIEVPLELWVEKGQSRILLLDILKFPYELLKILIRYKLC